METLSECSRSFQSLNLYVSVFLYHNIFGTAQQAPKKQNSDSSMLVTHAWQPRVTSAQSHVPLHSHANNSHLFPRYSLRSLQNVQQAMYICILPRGGCLVMLSATGRCTEQTRFPEAKTPVPRSCVNTPPETLRQKVPLGSQLSKVTHRLENKPSSAFQSLCTARGGT